MLKVTKSTKFLLTSQRCASFGTKSFGEDHQAAETILGQKSPAIYTEVKHNFNAGPGTLPRAVL